RLTIYPPYLREPWLDPRLARHVAALADPATGLAAEDARPSGLPWQEPDGGWGQDGSGRTDLHVTIDTAGRTHDRREDFAEVYGDDVTYVVTRNINFTNVCYTGCRFCAFAQRRTDADAYTLSLKQIGDRAAEAWDAGATEVCMQGGIHPDLPGTAYFEIASEVKRRCPDLHVHAFSPMEVVNGASRTGLPIREWLIRAIQAGVGSLQGTAAEILDDEVRWVLTKGKLPASVWIEVISTAHELGLRSSATMMYGQDRKSTRLNSSHRPI